MGDGDISENVNQARALSTQDDVANASALPFWGAMYQFAAGSVGTGFKLLNQTRPVLLFATKTSASISTRLQMAALSCESIGGKFFLNVGNTTTLSATTGATGNGANGAVLAANTSRKYLLLTNTDAANACWLNVGAASAVNNGIYLRPYGSYEMSAAYGNLDTGAINGWGVGGAVTISILQGV